MKLLVLAAVACAGIARADGALPTIDSATPPVIRISGVRDVAIERGDIVWMSFEVPAAKPRPITLDVPRGTLVVGLMLGDSHWGAPVTAEHDLSVIEQVPGAVLSWSSASGDVEHLVLAHVAHNCAGGDVVVQCPERVTLALVLPLISSVQIEPKPARIDGQPARSARIVVPAPRALDTVPVHVDADTSLAAVSQLPPTIRFEPTQQIWHDIDHKMIRRRLMLRRAGLRWCYQRVAQWTPGLEGTLVAHFTVERDGSIDDVSIDGDIEDDTIRDCLARELHAMEFPETDIAVRVNYPMTFTLADD